MIVANIMENFQLKEHTTSYGFKKNCPPEFKAKFKMSARLKHQCKNKNLNLARTPLYFLPINK